MTWAWGKFHARIRNGAAAGQISCRWCAKMKYEPAKKFSLAAPSGIFIPARKRASLEARQQIAPEDLDSPAGGEKLELSSQRYGCSPKITPGTGSLG